MQVGVLIEEPFPMLALDELCQRVHIKIEDALRNETLIRARVSANRKSRRSKNHSPNQNGWVDKKVS